MLSLQALWLVLPIFLGMTKNQTKMVFFGKTVFRVPIFVWYFRYNRYCRENTRTGFCKPKKKKINRIFYFRYNVQTTTLSDTHCLYVWHSIMILAYLLWVQLVMSPLLFYQETFHSFTHHPISGNWIPLKVDGNDFSDFYFFSLNNITDHRQGRKQ